MDELERSLLNVFTSSDLDRMVGKRKNESWLSELRCDSRARFTLFHNERFLVDDGSPCLLDYREVAQFNLDLEGSIFLGGRGGNYYFAIEVMDDLIIAKSLSKNSRYSGLRQIGESLKAEDATLLSYAKAMLHWHQAHIYCGACGANTRPIQGGHSRKCVNLGCERTHFPRTDPAIIVAVVHKGRCLFGRQQSWPPNRYSVIAGYVEPGESIEQAVTREVLEETNIEVSRVYYHSSQPWPFPGSVMLGFTADATSSDRIHLNDGELQEAFWKSTEDVVSAMESGMFRLPTRLSIAYRLVEDWFDANSDEKLLSVQKRLGTPTSW